MCNQQADQQKRCRRRHKCSYSFGQEPIPDCCAYCALYALWYALTKLHQQKKIPCRELESYSLAPCSELLPVSLCARRGTQVLVVMLPKGRVGRLHDESARTVLEKGLIGAAFWKCSQSPLWDQRFAICRSDPSVGPVPPALHGFSAVAVLAPFRGKHHLGTFLSGNRPVNRNTGNCFLQRATPRRKLLLALRHRGMLGDRIVPTIRPMHCTMPAVQFCR